MRIALDPGGSLTPRLRRLVIAAALVCAALGVFAAQPKTPRPDPSAPFKLTLPQPNPPPPALDAQGSVTVTPGPEPWYTLFASGEVVGYIEPCG